MTFFKNFRSDFPASIVVFLVALPLCLGIALASGAPLFAGITAGVVGGIVVGAISGSSLGVSGPGAGLAVLVFSGIAKLGSWEAFLVAVIMAGVLQYVAGHLKWGTIAYYFPSSVIKGMLTGIGLLIILKQIPHAFGYDRNFEGDEAFFQAGGQNTFSALTTMLHYLTPAAILISVVSLAILLFWENILAKKFKVFGLINGPLVAVVTGIGLSTSIQRGLLPLRLTAKHLVQLPVAGSIGEFVGQFARPDFASLKNPELYAVAVVLAIVASLETLLSVEATDKLDPLKRVTPANRELKAQGIGNIISGFLGGLPVTQVIVRSSTNITFGGRTKASTIFHGCLLLLCVVTMPKLLNKIPLATLASILILVGYKLAKPSTFKQMFKQKLEQFAPFIATVAAILMTDLLKGIALGMVVSIFFILRNNVLNPMQKVKMQEAGKEKYVITFSEEVTFLNKNAVLQTLNSLPPESTVVIDATKSKSVHYDVIEILRDFLVHAKTVGTKVEVLGLKI